MGGSSLFNAGMTGDGGGFNNTDEFIRSQSEKIKQQERMLLENPEQYERMMMAKRSKNGKIGGGGGGKGKKLRPIGKGGGTSQKKSKTMDLEKMLRDSSQVDSQTLKKMKKMDRLKLNNQPSAYDESMKHAKNVYV